MEVFQITGRFQVDPRLAARPGGPACARQRRPDVRRHATCPQSSIQRENWEFETHRRRGTLNLVRDLQYVVAR